MARKSSMNTQTFRFWAFLIGLGMVILAGTSGFAMVEGFSLVDSFYFSVVMVTTVGFGDLHPVTDAGKVLAVIMILMGVGTFTGVMAAAAEIILSRRERLQRLEKLNMVIGAFFSEMGTRLLVIFSDSDPQLESIREAILTATSCPDKEFLCLSEQLRKNDYSVDAEKVDLAGLRGFLAGKRTFMLRLVENPTLLEHEAFTGLLMAVFHLTEELIHREGFGDLPAADLKHLAGDIRRVYVMLVLQWLDYMRHLKNDYPYLFSLAMRTNPFDQGATPVVK
jgi:hypothetical protein